MKRIVKQILGLSAIGVIATIMIVANCIVLEPTLSQNITGLLCPPIVDSKALEQTRQGGQNLSNQIVQEGSVLVKNDNNTLPFDESLTRVNVFGHGSIDWVYGGSGSGQVIPENNNASENVDLLKALSENGIEYNNELIDMYKKYQPAVGDIGSISNFYEAFYKLAEPSIDDRNYYTESLLRNAKAYSDTALVVISRHAGETEDPTRVQYKHKESTDRERHYLEISKEEESLLKYVGENYENTVVIVNSTNTMELDFLKTIPGIDSCLWVGAPGTKGAIAIPSILWGEKNPSGRFTDTYAYDMRYNVNYKNSSAEGVGHYTNASDMYPTGKDSNAGVSKRTAPAFMDYVEGIYVGYKWYETAYAEGVWNDINNEYGQGYNGVVQFPFGYGLSYTKFDWNVQNINPTRGSAISLDSKISLDIEVTNSGDIAGQDVVEIYLTAPYHKGGVEKSFVNLVGFAKTIVLEPGQSQIITINIDPYDFASYDAYDKNTNGFKGYEIESGTYQLKIMTDSHNIKQLTNLDNLSNGIIEFEVPSTIKIENDKYTNNKVFNKFTGEDATDGVSLDGSDSQQNINFVSREAFPNPLTMPAVQSRDMADNIKANNEWSLQKASDWDKASTDVWGNPVHTEEVKWNQKNNKKVYENGQITELGLSLGENYDSDEWNAVLDQISLDEAKVLMRSASFGNVKIDSIGKPGLYDCDGPAQVRSFNAGPTRGTGFPCATVLAQTWSTSIAYSYGLNYGKEMNALNVDGVYGFGCNIHRSPWCGRNYEYLSEDGFLTAEMLTQEVKALKNTGKYTYLKHLVIQETEHERDSQYTWCTEQALREIYLKPFQKAIQEGGCVGIMSSYNRIGSQWTGGSTSLITGILRNEWGFKGAIVTDYVDGWSVGFMAIENAIRAGGNLLLGNRNFSFDTSLADSNRIQYQLREACHQVLFMWLSAGYTNANYNASDDVEVINLSSINAWVWWKPALIDLDILVFAVCSIWAYYILRKKEDDEAKEGEIKNEKI